MPRFYQYVETEVDVDINIDEFLNECDSDDIKTLVKTLKEDGWLKNEILFEDETQTIQESEMKENLTKIFNNRFLLSSEEEEFIKKISKRF